MADEPKPPGAPTPAGGVRPAPRIVGPVAPPGLHGGREAGRDAHRLGGHRAARDRGHEGPAARHREEAPRRRDAPAGRGGGGGRALAARAARGSSGSWASSSRSASTRRSSRRTATSGRCSPSGSSSAVILGVRRVLAALVPGLQRLKRQSSSKIPFGFDGRPSAPSRALPGTSCRGSRSCASRARRSRRRGPRRAPCAAGSRARPPRASRACSSRPRTRARARRRCPGPPSAWSRSRGRGRGGCRSWLRGIILSKVSSVRRGGLEEAAEGAGDRAEEAEEEEEEEEDSLRKVKRGPGPSQRWRAGADGEDLASSLLEENSLRILDRNVRYPDGEIDIVALDGATTVFVEVKRRRDEALGDAGRGRDADEARARRAGRPPLARGAPGAGGLRAVRRRRDRGRSARRDVDPDAFDAQAGA